jgi:integrase
LSSLPRLFRGNEKYENFTRPQSIEQICDSESLNLGYTARHSFSTVLKRSGVSIEFISESLSHNDLRTTELYLDSFEDEKKKEVAKHLTSFKTQLKIKFLKSTAQALG